MQLFGLDCMKLFRAVLVEKRVLFVGDGKTQPAGSVRVTVLYRLPLLWVACSLSTPTPLFQAWCASVCLPLLPWCAPLWAPLHTACFHMPALDPWPSCMSKGTRRVLAWRPVVQLHTRSLTGSHPDMPGTLPASRTRCSRNALLGGTSWRTWTHGR